MRDKRRVGNNWRLREGEQRLLLLVGDFFAASGAAILSLAFWAQRDAWLGFTMQFVRDRAPWFWMLPLIWVLIMINNYDPRTSRSLSETLKGILTSAGIGMVLYLLVYFNSEQGSLPRSGILYFLVLATLFTLCWRFVYVKISSTSTLLRRVLIIGAGESGLVLSTVIKKLNPPPFRIVGFIDDDSSKRHKAVVGIPVVGDSSNLLEVISEMRISDLIVAINGPMNGRMFQGILDAQQEGIEIIRMPVSYEEILGRVPIRHLESDWLLRSFVDDVHVSILYMILKRLIDILGAMIGLMVMILLLPFITLGILSESGKPIIFRQKRIGTGGSIFTIIKFRTMRQDAEDDGQARWAEDHDQRVTRVGRLLRNTHVDELPQFWNVLMGEMSIVGPRPERPSIVQELEKKIPFYRARLLTKPGITGWAQINQDYAGTVESSAEKLEYDLYYIKHRSLWMDLNIIVRTIGAVLGFRGV